MLTTVFFNILGPILLLVSLGAVMRRKFAIDLGTLSKLNLYLFTPAFVFHYVSTSTLRWSEMGGIVLVCVLQVIALGVLVYGAGRMLGVNRKTLSAVALAVMFYNSGNYGLPLAELAFPKNSSSGNDGAAVQTFVLMSQNILTFTVGLLIASSARHSFGRSVLAVLRLPVLPTLAAALLARAWLGADPAHQLPAIISTSARYLANGLVPVALVTLGAQLASNPRWPRWKPVGAVVLLRLIVAPTMMAAMLLGLHQLNLGPALSLWPWPAMVLILTAAVPSAINTLLLTMELGGDTDLAADCVFWTTVASAITITAWLVIVMSGLG